MINIYPKKRHLSCATAWLLLLFFGVNSSLSQIQVNQADNNLEIAESLIGSGFQIVNVSINCPEEAFGTFENGTGANLDIDRGVILSTGKIEDAVGPNSLMNTTTNFGASGDSRLDQIAGDVTFDACMVTIEIIAQCDSLSMEYVFASEEYLEYVSREFADVFACFVSGPDPDGGTYFDSNIVYIPGTKEIMNVNAVHPFVPRSAPVIMKNVPANNQEYYVDNANGTGLEYDGFTKSMQAGIRLVECEKYKISLVIADASDGVFDSGVFIKGESISCSSGSPTIDSVFVQDIIENCQDGKISLCRFDNTADVTIDYFIEGTADNSDYTSNLSGGTIQIPAGTSCYEIDFEPINDGVTEPLEFINFYYSVQSACPDTQLAQIKVFDEELAETGPDVEICSGESIIIGSDSVVGQTYEWSPVNGLSDPLISNPVVSLENNTNVIEEHIYSVIITTKSGCIREDSLKVTVHPSPTSNFSFPDSLCSNQEVQFKDESQSATSNLADWYWTFNNSDIQVLQNPKMTYIETGNFDIELVVTDEKGCKDTSYSTINIFGSPTADFIANSPCIGEPVLFENESTPFDLSDPILSSDWDLGDNNTETTNATDDLNYTYQNAGIFIVKLSVVTKNGCTSEQTKKVKVNGVGSLNLPDVDVCPDENKIMGIPPTLSYTYQWTPTNGLSDPTASNPKISLPNNSNTIESTQYTLSLTNQDGCVTTDSITVNVYPLPSADFTFDPSNKCEGDEIQFTNASTSNNGKIAEFYWNFGNGYFSVEESPKCRFSVAGTYDVSLTIVNSAGCISDTVSTLTIDPNPTLSIENSPICFGDTSYFKAVSDYDLSQWKWDFGDQQYGEGEETSHFYDKDGKFYVRLIGLNDQGCPGEASINVEVNSKPKVDFDANEVCLKDTTLFFNHSFVIGDKIVGWEWNFDDGNTSNNPSPTHAFFEAGTFNVMLKATTLNGECSDEKIKEVRVVGPPIAEFETENDFSCQYSCVEYKDLSTSDNEYDIHSYYWDFGNGKISKEANPSHCFEEPGTFSTYLRIENEFGCVDSALKENFIEVWPTPDAGFVKNKSLLTEFDSEVKITDNSIGSTEWEYDFGDGNVYYEPTPIHTYEEAGNFQIIQVVSNEYACRDTAYRNVFIRAEKEIWIPNTFTPDGDGVNDYFQPYVTGLFKEFEYTMFIFNRWGELIFKTSGLGARWDGTVQVLGKTKEIAQIDTYVYKIILNNPNDEESDYRYAGKVNLIR